MTARTTIVSAFVAALLVSSAGAIDILVLSNNKKYEGLFDGYKTGKVVFEPTGGKTVREQPTNIKTLTLDPPAKAFVKPRSGKDLSDITLKGFEKSKFTFDKDGSNVTMTASSIVKIDMPLDFSRALQATSPGLNVASNEDFDVMSLVKSGSVTIIHFHMEGVVSDARYGSYVKSISEKSGGKIVLHKLDIVDWSSPLAQACVIESIPQFWFYDAKGRLAKKLVDFKTTEEIDAALKSATGTKR